MKFEIGLTKGPINSRHAPLAVLFAYYKNHADLKPLEQVQISTKTREFQPVDKLIQILLSILADCKTLSEVNSTLNSEVKL